ncbi:MAG: hypothetical protein JW991_05290 [Candidatus Pacebacteria bacterium]|nr:hypothetical protein [Candidatus Paceibacterota bacterium]
MPGFAKEWIDPAGSRGADGWRILSPSSPSIAHSRFIRAIECRSYSGNYLLAPLAMGVALGDHLVEESLRQNPVVVFGVDPREYQHFLGLIGVGLNARGVTTVNLDIATTAAVSQVTNILSADLGMACTASHSHHDHSGVKNLGSDGLRLSEEQEAQLCQLMSDAPMEFEPVSPEEEGQGIALSRDLLDDWYVKGSLIKPCPVSLNGFGVVFDCAHGAAVRFAEQAFKGCDGQAASVFKDSYLSAPLNEPRINYQCGAIWAEDHPETYVSLINYHRAQVAFATDGDGDRVTAIDPQGRVFTGEDFLYIIALWLKSKGKLPDATVVTNHQANLGLEDSLEPLGVRIVRTPNGDRHLEETMWEQGFALGFEEGGNGLFNDGIHRAADGIWTSILLSAIMVKTGCALKELTADFRRRIQLRSSVFLSFLPGQEAVAGQLSELDIIKSVERDGGRFLHWSSSTEAGKYRLLIEEPSNGSLARAQAALAQAEKKLRETALT